MKALSLDDATLEYIEQLYWVHGQKLEAIAGQFERARGTVQEWFARYKIPTCVTFIRNFNDYAESDKLEFYLKGYMTHWNRFSYDSSSNKVTWRVVSEVKPSLRTLQSFLKNKAYVEGSVVKYKESNAYIACGLKKCWFLSEYFELDWRDELQSIHEESPWPGMKLGHGEAVSLVVSFTNGEWQPAAEIAGLVGYSVKYTSRILKTAAEKGYVEKRPISKNQFEYRRTHHHRI